MAVEKMGGKAGEGSKVRKDEGRGGKIYLMGIISFKTHEKPFHMCRAVPLKR